MFCELGVVIGNGLAMNEVGEMGSKMGGGSPPET